MDVPVATLREIGRIVRRWLRGGDEPSSPPPRSEHACNDLETPPVEWDQPPLRDEEGLPPPREFYCQTGLPAERYLVALVEANGGRLKQHELVNHTGWPKSTVSTLLAEVEEEGRITRVPVGRENLVYLPKTLPDMAAPPFADDSP